MSRANRVAVGLSGGVDSSLTAALLLEQGFDVVGVHLQMVRSVPGSTSFTCTSAADRQDAIRAAAHLGIPVEVVDAEALYEQDVLEPFFAAYAQNLTPNPDVWCNERVKFPLLLATAERLGVGTIATGHYAQTDRAGGLLRGVDPAKDQSYFLATLSSDVLASTVFPLGAFHKTDVRAKAEALGLPAAHKKDSVGLCFVGDVSVGDLLRTRLSLSPGPVLDTEKQEVGRHDGLPFYTIGQRHGLSHLQRPGPWHVVGKDLEHNALLVTDRADDPARFCRELVVENVRWISGNPLVLPAQLQVQLRHRGEAYPAQLERNIDGTLRVRFEASIPTVAPGQLAAFYKGEQCLGSASIRSTMVFS